MLARNHALGWLLPALVGMGGCTAGIATAKLVTANKALVEAKDRGAVELAPYHYTLAERHLHKAMEEHGASEFKVSIALSKAASGWAESSIIYMEGGGRDIQDLGTAGEDLSDRPEEDDLLRDAPAPIEVGPQEEEEELPDDEFLDDPEDDEDDAWEAP